MSAKAASAPWEKWGVGWTPTPNSYFDRLPRALSVFEHAITGFILRATIGNHQDGRPEWAQISETKFALLVDGSVNGVSKAIERLEEAGVIESKRVGRAKQYRCCIEQWDRVQLRGARKLDRTAEVGDEDVSGEASLCEEMPAAAMRSGGSGEAECAMVECPACRGIGRVTEEAAIKIDNAIVAAQGLSCQIPPLECGIPEPQTPPGSADDAPGFDEFYEFVDGQLRKPLAEPAPRAMMNACYQRLAAGGVDLEYFKARFGMRRHAIRSYGFISLLVDDCLRAAASARQAERQVAAADPAEDWTATIKRHVNQRMKEISEAKLARQLSGALPFRELLDALRQTARDAARHAADIPRLEMHLGNIEAMMRSIVEDQQDGEAKAAVDDAVERDVGRHRARMTKDAFESARAVAYERRLFEFHGLPRLLLCRD